MGKVSLHDMEYVLDRDRKEYTDGKVKMVGASIKAEGYKLNYN